MSAADLSAELERAHAECDRLRARVAELEQADRDRATVIRSAASMLRSTVDPDIAFDEVLP